MRRLIYVALFLIACKQPAPPTPAQQAEAASDIPADQSNRGLTVNKKFWVEYTPSVNPIPFNQIFSLTVRVADPERHDQPLASASLDEARITMPAHGHGMKVKHTIEPGAEPGTFIIKGLQLHMNGEGENGRWALEFVINDRGTIDQASFDVQCCRD